LKIHLLVAVLVFITILSPAYGERIVYLAEQDFAYVSELYRVDTQAPGITTKLNPSLSPFARGISDYEVSPDGLRVFYRADVASPGQIGLFVTEIENPGNSIQLGPLPVNVAAAFGRFSPDSRKVAFTLADDTFATVGVFVADLTTSTPPIQLTPDFGPNGSMGQTAFQFTPDGRHIVYTAAELDVHDLYLVSLDAPGVATKLNPPDGSIGDSFEGFFEITPDGQRVVYASVLDNPGVRELHVVNLSEPGVATTLNAAFQSGGEIFSFAVAPDARHVLYVADQEIDNKLEVYLADLDNPGKAVKLNAPVQSNAGLAQFTPDGTHVVYAGDAARQVGARDLYMVPIEQPGNAVRLNAMVESNVDIHAYIISPDGTRIAYQTDPPGFPREIYISELNSPGTAMRLNGSLPTGALDRSMAFSPKSEEVAFVAVESVTTSIYELFVARLAEPGISTKLNEELPPDGIVIPHSFRNNFSYVPTNSPLIDLSGTIKTSTGTDICAMVLASGKFMFSCNPPGVFSLTGLPSENDGTVKRQIYADGFFPKADILTGSSDNVVIMTRSGTCPSYNIPYEPASAPGSAGKHIYIAGQVFLQNSQTPICAMVLANGQHMFSCDGTGSYAMKIPLDNNGQFKLQVYADGFAPSIRKFDEFKTTNIVRMSRATECQ
jgi:Tol biopolymer transport system component